MATIELTDNVVISKASVEHIMPSVDTSNVLKSFPSGQKVNYTAIQDCWVIFTLNHESYGNNTAYLNGSVIAGCDGNKKFASVIAYLKTGQTITTTGQIPSQQSRPGYVYGVNKT